MTTNTPRKTDHIDKRNGVDAYGLQIEFVRYGAETGRLISQVQAFLALNTIFLYERKAGAKSARWQSKSYDTQEEARDALRKVVENADAGPNHTEIIGEPVRVQLTETDVTAIKEGLKPTARFDAGLRNTRLFGKIDDEEWRSANA